MNPVDYWVKFHQDWLANPHVIHLVRYEELLDDQPAAIRGVLRGETLTTRLGRAGGEAGEADDAAGGPPPPLCISDHWSTVISTSRACEPLYWPTMPSSAM